MRNPAILNLLILFFCMEGFDQSQSDHLLPEMIKIHGGTFNMGSNEQDYDTPVHRVAVTDFYLGKYEVTVAQFYYFVQATGYTTDAETHGDSSWIFREKMPGVDWRSDAQGHKYENLADNHFPIVFVSWNDAQAYCVWLSNKTGKHFRLPTEAEWEYAAGNGTAHTRFSWGNLMPESTHKVANVRDEGSGWDNNFTGYNDGYKFLAPVGSFKPNDFGLYDMTGNVNEWCSDWYGKYTSEDQTNPQGPTLGVNRATRGGSFASRPVNCTVADHNDSPPGESRGTIGFRLALDP